MIGAGPGGIALWAALHVTSQASMNYRHRLAFGGYHPMPLPSDDSNAILRQTLRRQYPEHRENVTPTHEQDLPKTDPEMERRKQEAFQRALEENALSTRYTLGLK